MAQTSELIRLYRVVFGSEPNEDLVTELMRLEQTLGFSEDDPMARMLIVLMRVADHMAKRVEKPLHGITQALAELKVVTRNLTTAELRYAALITRATTQPLPRGDERKPWFAPVKVSTYHVTFPILAYLKEAFLSSSAGNDSERVVAARWSLFLSAITAMLVFVVGMGAGRFLIR